MFQKLFFIKKNNKIYVLKYNGISLTPIYYIIINFYITGSDRDNESNPITNAEIMFNI
jgi:hypothetical protein